jgi:hypothetical protein
MLYHNIRSMNNIWEEVRMDTSGGHIKKTSSSSCNNWALHPYGKFKSATVQLGNVP